VPSGAVTAGDQHILKDRADQPALPIVVHQHHGVVLAGHASSAAAALKSKSCFGRWPKLIQIEISSLFVPRIRAALWDLLLGWALRADGAAGVAARCRGVGPRGL